MTEEMFDPGRDPDRFDPGKLDKTIIALPLMELIKKSPKANLDIIIDLNFNYKGGRLKAREKIIEIIHSLDPQTAEQSGKKITRRPDVKEQRTRLSPQYVFASIPAFLIKTLVQMDRMEDPAIYKVWPDFELSSQTTVSISTVKADAAHHSFYALGENITWAVMDSGIDFSHPHFELHKNKSEDYHLDLNTDDKPFEDGFGHGTHVAGIIAGEAISSTLKIGKNKIFSLVKSKDENGDLNYRKIELTRISGMAPKCKLVSLKVLGNDGRGQVSSLIAAIGHIQEINSYGRDIKIHGVNMSLGYGFDPEWFACGQSPICVEVNRLVKSGVVVVAAAGNTGYGFVSTKFNDRMATGLSLSINDPGNAELAITVGSTHREMPHTFGVSYFSSKGPTGDGRIKPDLVAPGEKIISCATGFKMKSFNGIRLNKKDVHYLEDSGTSMAAPHVSGAIAAFLSIRREYIGQAEKVKEIFTGTATDLKREPYFQGKGLLDLMRAIQSV